MQHEGRKCKIVNKLCLVRAIAEVGEIVHMRHVGLGDEYYLRRNLVQHSAHELDDVMRLGEMNACCADLLPQIGDCIQPDEPGATFDIEQEHVERGKEDGGIAEIQVDLVCAKRSPNPL